jgi:preprotein translocase subunit SecE
VADKDEVGPTDESSAALPADARDDAAAKSEDADDLPGDEPVDGKPADELADPSIDDEPENLTEPDDPDADFNEIVRNSGASDPDGNADDGDDKVLEPAGVGAAAAGRSGSTARPTPTPKGTPTSKRDQPAKREPRTTPAKFVRQSVGELRKVVYPTGEQLIKYFVVVLVFVLFIIAYVSLLDLGFGAAIFKIFS